MDAGCVAVAYSGGRDSTALLHATLRAAASQHIQVAALHVHHGLNPQADAWLAHCERQCAQWARGGLPVRFAARRLGGAPSRGESVEAWARDERYRALAEMAGEQGATLVLLAHHRRDQAETFVLQALRGAGVAGLAAMPPIAERRGLRWARPWLAHPREAVERYVQQYRLAYVEDDSNQQPRHARNRLRLSVWPALTESFPQAEAALADAARWSQQAACCLAELADIDLHQVADDRGLNLAAWGKLSSARRVNALRHWMHGVGGKWPAASLVSRLLDESARPGPARWIDGDREWRRYRGWLRSYARAVNATDGAARTAQLVQQGERVWEAPGWNGRLETSRVSEGGVAEARLGGLRLAARRGGEQFQRAPGSPPRSLKKQFQALGVPPWERNGPLLFDGEQLVFVPGLGIDARAVAEPGQAQLSLRWLPSSKD